VVFHLSGEPLIGSGASKILSFLNEHCRFYNYYGCAECTGAVSQYMIANNYDNMEFLLIGRPMPNVHIYLLDEYLQPVIPGIQTGEIVIGGNN
jgi:non-ribosomal peptide synthetase component F